MKRLPCTVVSLALALLIGGIASAEDELSLYEMDEVVITGSKVPKTPGNVTQSIEIISAAQIDNRVLANGNLTEILSYSPGNFSNVLSRSYPNWGSSGGLAHNYKSYMVDGLPVDAFIEPMSLDSWAMERIEDQRGSASVLYPNYLDMDNGNQSAMAGTANFILKDHVSEPLTAFSAYYGSYNTLGAKLFHQKAVGNLHYFIGGSQEDADYTSYRADLAEVEIDSVTKVMVPSVLKDPQYSRTKLYARGTYFLDGSPDHRAGIYIHRTWHDGDEGRPNRGYDYRYTTLNATYARPIGEQMTLQVKAGHRDVDRTWESDYWEKPALHPGLRKEAGMHQKVMPADISLSYQHSDDDLLTVGADYQFVSYQTWTKKTQDYSIDNDAEATHVGVYAQEEQVLGKLVLRAGGRLNYIAHDIELFGGKAPIVDSESWTKLLGSAGVRYNMNPALSMFANVGSSFRAPGLKSVGGTVSADSAAAGHSGQLPNPDLDPESGMSIDLGAKYRVSEDLSLGFRAFTIRLKDQILQNVVSVDPSQSQGINAGETSTQGLETEVSYDPGDWWRCHANYTYTTTDITNPEDPDKDGADVNMVPRQMANIGVDVALPNDLTASINLQVIGTINSAVSNSDRKEVDGYQVLNARIEKLFVQDDGYDVRMYLEPYNLLNKDFDMPWGFRDPGFALTGGVTASF